jgi:decaprenylphospho-beta-D-ribofuranose 2-oxidase
VLLASGEVVTASRTEHSDLFWASFGGVGLLGIILEATITLRRISSAYFRQQAVVCDSLDALLDALDEHDSGSPYSVATIDPGATGRRLGRGVLTIGDHAQIDELPPKLKATPFKVGTPSPLVVPLEMPGFALNPVTAGILNRVIDQVLRRAATYSHYESFFYPLDAVGEWNLAYGPRGFTQYQFVIPLDHGRARMRELLEAIVSSGMLPFLNVLKRLGPQSEGHLGFPFKGYTLAIDFPIRDGTQALAHRLDAMVIAAGGRNYLGKDSFLTKASLRAMYPRLDEWLAIKAKYDPKSVFQSDLGRRVGLVP